MEHVFFNAAGAASHAEPRLAASVLQAMETAATAAPKAPLVTVGAETPADVAAREALLDRAFGEARFRKTCERLREGRTPARGLALAAHVDGALVGTLRFWHVASASGHDMLMLGPLAVESEARSLGIGGRLMREGLRRAKMRGHGAVMLVGDEPYYRRFGFSAAPMRDLDLPGEVDRARFLGLELKAGALAGASGMIRATGAIDVHAFGTGFARAA